MGRLDGKIAAVTGGASGIGEATVRRFVAEGASVAFCDRDGERGQRVAAELETAGAKVAFTQADVGTEAACLAFVNGAAQNFGRLDILINNAGIRKYMFGALAEFERSLIRERTQAGLAAARRAGRTGGRPPKLTDDDIEAAKALLANPDIGVTQIAHRLGVSPATLYRYIPAARTANLPD